MAMGNNIELLRKLNKMNQHELGKMLNVSNKTVSSWEKNRTEPKIEMINAMCKIFNCSIEEITDSVHLDYITNGNMVKKSQNNDFSDLEREIIKAFRQADFVDQNSVLRILGIEKKEALSGSKIS